MAEQKVAPSSAGRGPEEEYFEIMRQLKIVSVLQRADKIRTQPGSCSIESVRGALQGVVRFIRDEGRAKNVEFLRGLTRRAFGFYDGLSEAGISKRRADQMRSRVRATLDLYKGGLQNLAQTYAEDIETSTQIKMLAESIEDWTERKVAPGEEAEKKKKPDSSNSLAERWTSDEYE